MAFITYKNCKKECGREVFLRILKILSVFMLTLYEVPAYADDLSIDHSLTINAPKKAATPEQKAALKALNTCLIRSIAQGGPFDILKPCLNIGIDWCNKTGMKAKAKTLPISGRIIIDNSTCSFNLERQKDLARYAYNQESDHFLRTEEVGYVPQLFDIRTIAWEQNSTDPVVPAHDDTPSSHSIPSPLEVKPLLSDYEQCLSKSMENGNDSATAIAKCDAPPTECDVQAAMGFISGKKKYDVPLDKIDPKLAIPACQNALKKYPESSRLFFALGRSYLKGGNIVQGVPSNVGDCALSKLSIKGTRLESAPGSGSAVLLENKIIQVSYETVDAIEGSAIGDPIKVCLLDIETNCPAGSDPGKTYSTLNIRTGAIWVLPNSEHGCGN